MVHIQTNFTADAMNTGKKADAVVVVAPVKAEPKKKAKPEPVVETPVVEEVVVLAEPEEVAVVEEAPVAE